MELIRGCLAKIVTSYPMYVYNFSDKDFVGRKFEFSLEPTDICLILDIKDSNPSHNFYNDKILHPYTLCKIFSKSRTGWINMKLLKNI